MNARACARIRRVVALLEEAHGPRQWRPRGDGLGGLIRTILSQHTSDVNSGTAYASLRQTFGSWEQVMRARQPSIARAIRTAGLGQVKSARIKGALRQIHTDQGELSLEFLKDLPPQEARQYLEALDGVGPKTAACVLMFNFGMPVLPVDTHVHRLARRLGLIAPRVSAEEAHTLLAAQVPPELVYPFHVLLITHGREVCRARNPRCGECVLRRFCRALSTGSPRRASP